jgi:hypothetical protein
MGIEKHALHRELRVAFTAAVSFQSGLPLLGQFGMGVDTTTCIILLLLLPFALVPPSEASRKRLQSGTVPYAAEFLQDQYLEENLFSGRLHGTFLEAGCLDGVAGSNTYYFEANRGWKGVCVEPNADLAAKANKNRGFVLNSLLCEATIGPLKYTRFAPPYESYNGIWDFIPEYKRKTIQKFIDENRTRVISTTPVPCMPLLDVLDAFGQRHLDLMSLDVEVRLRALRGGWRAS